MSLCSEFGVVDDAFFVGEVTAFGMPGSYES